MYPFWRGPLNKKCAIDLDLDKYSHEQVGTARKKIMREKRRKIGFETQRGDASLYLNDGLVGLSEIFDAVSIAGVVCMILRYRAAIRAIGHASWCYCISTENYMHYEVHVCGCCFV